MILPASAGQSFSQQLAQNAQQRRIRMTQRIGVLGIEQADVPPVLKDYRPRPVGSGRKAEA